MKLHAARLGTLPILWLLVGLATLPAGADQARDLTWSGAIPAGGSFAVSGVNGNISADAAAGAEATLVAHASSKLGDVSKVRLQVKQSPKGVIVCAVTPNEEVSEDCSSTHSIGNVDRDHAIRVDFTVRVPRGSDFRARTVNGRIRIAALGGPVDAKTVNGSISVATAPRVAAKTVNGSIEARIGDPKWIGDLAFKTVNGSISVVVPAGSSFSVNARTVNGAIDARAFGLESKGRFVGRSLDGTVGTNSAGKSLSLRTVNGSIALSAADGR